MNKTLYTGSIKKEKGDLVWRQKNTVGMAQNRLV